MTASAGPGSARRRPGRQMHRGSGLQPHWPDRLSLLISSRRRGGRRARAMRRALAAALMIFAGVLAVSGSTTAASGVAVLAVIRDLPAGAALTAGDVAVRAVLEPPDGALRSPPEATGRLLSGPVRRGELLTDARLVPAGGPAAGVGRVAVPVRPADPATVELLSPGVHVAVLAVTESGRSTMLARDAVVLAIPPPARSDPGKRLVVLAVPAAAADAITAAGIEGSVALRFT